MFAGVPSVLRTSGVSGPPSVISISPFVSGVTDGYQRPAAMFGPEAPAVGRGVEQVRLDDPFELRVLVAAGEEQRTVEEVGEAGAEDVVTRIESARRVWCP